MASKLFKNIAYLSSFDTERRELSQAYILVEGNLIKEVGTGEPPEAEETYDCSNLVIVPGFVNTHHHMFQSLTRCVRAVQSAKLFDWLLYLYGKWKNIDYEAVYVSSLVAIYEMMASGVTTTSDMLYLYPRGRVELFDAEVEAARRAGIRFYPTRGAMTLGRSRGGLPPDEVVEDDEVVLAEFERVVGKYHNKGKGAMVKVAFGPCAPFNVTEHLLLKSVELAEKLDVLLHTHLAETKDEERYCLERFGKGPVEYMESLGWTSSRVWFAHLVWIDDSDIELLERNDVGMAHCPTSNMRLGSGIAPVSKLLGRIRIGLGVDGSASNDSNNMLLEARNALFAQRAVFGAQALSPRDVLEMATLGGCKVLKIDDFAGSIEPGKVADFAGFRVDTLEFSGVEDPVAGLVLCPPKNADLVVINGETRVKEGRAEDPDLDYIIRKHNEISKKILGD